MARKYFEDLEKGYTVRTCLREITQEMINAFAEITGDKNPIHIKEHRVSESEFGRKVARGKRIAHGELTSAVAIGLLNDYDMLEGMGLLETNKMYKRPVWPGDSIYCVCEVLECHPFPRMNEFGVVVCGIKVFNQNDKEVIDMEVHILAERRNKECASS